jgi:hypothetical protein
MSTEVKEIQDAIAQDLVPDDMPPQFRRACVLALTTNTLYLSKSGDGEVRIWDLKNHIIPFVIANPNIHTLNISYNRLFEWSEEAAWDAEIFKSSTQAIYALENMTSLQNLNVANTGITSKEAEILLKTLAKLPNFHTLDISHNGALGFNPSLRTNPSKLKEQVTATMNAFGNISSLQDLNIDGTNLNAEQAETLLKALDKLLNLHTLTIREIDPGEVNIQLLANSTSLRHLIITTHPLGSRHQDAIGKIFSAALLSNSNQTLTTIIGLSITSEMKLCLRLNEEHVTPEECNIITETLEKRLTQNLVPLVLMYRGIKKNDPVAYSNVKQHHTSSPPLEKTKHYIKCGFCGF